MWITKKYFEKWVEKTIGLKNSTNSSLFSWFRFDDQTVRDEIGNLKSKNLELESKLDLLSEKLKLKYTVIREKKCFVSRKK